MVVPPDVRVRLEYVKPYMMQVGGKVKDLVLAHCEEHGFAFTSRFKEIASLAEKIETGRFAKWSELDDLYACTVVVPSLTYENDVIDFLRQSFDEVVLRKRGSTQKDPSVFRYDSTRFVGKLRPLAATDAGEEVFKIRFEVQVRTAFEHAWSVTTHALAYKGKQVDWKKMRLTAQLKASVEQLDTLVLGFEASSSFISEHQWPEVQAMVAIEELFAQYLEKGTIPKVAQPTNWTRFCENAVRLLKATHRPNDKRPRVERLASEAIAALKAELDGLTAATFPRSMSLSQFLFGVLAKANTISPPLTDFVPLITTQLADIYPDVRKFTTGFELES